VVTARDRLAQVGWLNGRFGLAFIATSRSLVDGDLVGGLLLGAVSNANTAHLDAHPDVARRHLSLDKAFPDEVRRPVNAMSLAESLGLPRETVRQRAVLLAERGILRRMDGGFVVPLETLGSEPFIVALAAYLRATEALMDGLARVGGSGVEGGSRMVTPVWPVAWAALRLATAHALRETSYLRAVAPDLSLVQAFVYEGLAQTCGLQLRLAGESTVRLSPAEVPIRDAVRAADLARELELPEETARRHLRTLAGAGLIERTPGGFRPVVSDPGLRSRWLARQKRTATATHQLVWRMAATGLMTSTS